MMARSLLTVCGGIILWISVLAYLDLPSASVAAENKAANIANENMKDTNQTVGNLTTGQVMHGCPFSFC